MIGRTNASPRVVYTLTGTAESNAPTHPMLVTLYAAKAGITDNALLMLPDSYDTSAPVAEDVLIEPAGTWLWRQVFTLRSQKLGRGVYMLVVQKGGHVTYTRVNIRLSPAAAVGNVFHFPDVIKLITGDLDGNGKVQMMDIDLVSYYMGYNTKSYRMQNGDLPSGLVLPPGAPVID